VNIHVQRPKAFTQQKNQPQRVLAKNHNTNCVLFLNMLESVVSVFERVMIQIVIEYQKNAL